MQCPVMLPNSTGILGLERAPLEAVCFPPISTALDGVTGMHRAFVECKRIKGCEFNSAATLVRSAICSSKRDSYLRRCARYLRGSAGNRRGSRRYLRGSGSDLRCSRNLQRR